MGGLRGDIWKILFSGNWSDINFSAGLEDVLSGRVLELRNAAMLMEAGIKTGKFGYGTGIWNSIIFQYVPGQIFGQEFKKSLYINLTNYNLGELFGFNISNGSTVTAIGDTFVEFSYLGCLTFAIVSYFFKNLWVSAIIYRSTYSQILYAGLISPVLVV
ncbi:MAG: hypothetical protein HC908_12495 [Calothrix sp. SM1_7_51]|nr:hypothetical protein [Calothrix sp. SM1_7_51]